MKKYSFKTKFVDVCWDLWFCVGLIETMLNENNKKDSDNSCLFLYMRELDKIQAEIQTLKLSYQAHN